MRVRSWLLLLLFVATASNLGIIFSAMLFEAQSCRLSAAEYGRDYAQQDIAGCKGLIAWEYLSLSAVSNSVYLPILVFPLAIAAALAAITGRASPVTLAGFAYYCGVLVLLMGHVLIASVLGLWGLAMNNYYLASRCPDNVIETDDCQFVIKNYNLGNQEITSYLALSGSAIIASAWMLKIIRDGASTLGYYRNRRTA